MVRSGFITILILFLSYTIYAQDTTRLQLIFAGDIMGHDSQIASAREAGTADYDYTSYFRNLPWLKTADIALANLEVTLAGPPYKGYPQFSSPDELARTARDAGFDILVTANNHSLDRRKQGLERTTRVLDSLGIIHTGTFSDSLTRALHYPLVVEKKGIRIALLNYTYGTNGLRVQSPNIVNYIDTAQIAADLEKAGQAEPDLIIAFVHWGNEYERTENSTQRKIAAFLFSHGADAIIGSHPHVVQPISRSDDGRPVVWSLGNMISNQRERYRNGGIMVALDVEKTDAGSSVSSVSYLPYFVYKPMENGKVIFTLVPAALVSEIPETADISTEDKEAIKQFLDDTTGNIPGFEPVGDGWYKEKPGEKSQGN